MEQYQLEANAAVVVAAAYSTMKERNVFFTARVHRQTVQLDPLSRQIQPEVTQQAL